MVENQLKILNRDSFTCLNCGTEVGFKTNDDVPTAEIHHLTPVSQGGSDSPENLATLCSTCHQKTPLTDRRALLTEREREIVSGEADDVTDEYRYQTVSRIRSRLQRLEDDLDALEAHGDLAEELRNIVCDTDSEQ
jgi:hypothetical protein